MLRWNPMLNGRKSLSAHPVIIQRTCTGFILSWQIVAQIQGVFLKTSCPNTTPFASRTLIRAMSLQCPFSLHLTLSGICWTGISLFISWSVSRGRKGIGAGNEIGNNTHQADPTGAQVLCVSCPGHETSTGHAKRHRPRSALPRRTSI